ncbi:MAG: zinc metalloprotease HtpX [Candidatus Thermoplasmatota archaeon]|jgi:heat shock protein HtpX|nr:zinc metalloprotease HtpX [Candidatus Thermoplasmatota archaeon]MCL5955347.1 zinc metalloprotease HtpX [Candidatus Thermoplasmatota archaeon]
MDLLSAKLRVASLLGGIAIALIAAAIIISVIRYFFGAGFSLFMLSLILLLILAVDVIQWLFSPYLMRLAYKLSPVPENDINYSWLLEMIHRISSQSGITTPKVYIAEVGFPNAFAYSSPIAGRRVAITRPLFNLLTREELEAVLAHELGHLKHRDVELLFAIGLIPSLIFYVAYGLIFSSNNRQQSGYAFIVALALMALSFVFNLVILGINRMRETYADINATIYAENGASNLQTALAKIVSYSGPKFRRRKTEASNITSMLLFSDINSESDGNARALLEKWRKMEVSVLHSIFSSHPHPAKRIQMLENIKKKSI